MLNLFVKTARDADTAAAIANDLIAMAKQTEKAAWWEADTPDLHRSRRRERADLETTGLAAYGLVRWGRNSGFVTKVLTYLVQSKDAFGTWQTTQGTVWSMKALLAAQLWRHGRRSGHRDRLANGQKAATVAITAEDSDVMRQIDMREWLKPDRNEIRLTYEGKGSLLYQIASRSYIPWDAANLAPATSGPLSIGVAYDRTQLTRNDTATVTVTVKNLTDKVAEMPLVDVGVPPGSRWLRTSWRRRWRRRRSASTRWRSVRSSSTWRSWIRLRRWSCTTR